MAHEGHACVLDSLPDELPLSDEEVLGYIELAQSTGARSAEEQQGGPAELVGTDDMSEFSLAPTGQRPGKG